MAPRLQVRRYPLRDGDTAIAQTIKFMRGAALGNEGARNPQIRATALQIVQNVPSRDYRQEVAAIFAWVQQHIRFCGEFAETVQTPLTTLHLGAGDCDDQSVLLAGLLGALGHQTRFVTVAGDPADPQSFTHVYLETLDRASGQWIPLDTTQAGSYPGWAPDRVTRKQAWKPMGDASMPYQVPGQLGPTGTLIYDLAQRFGGPLVDAYAQQTAYPSGALLFGRGGDIGFSTGMASNFPWGWMLLIAGGFALYSMGGRR